MPIALPRTLSCVLFCLLVSGCGSKKTATSPVTGAVTYNGTPVDGATVVFAPVAGGRPATAITDAQGRYSLTFGAQGGAPAGDYEITVTKMVTEGEMPNLTPEQVNEMQMKNEPVPGPVAKSVLPPKYGGTATSGLSYSVKAGSNDFDIPLKD